MRKVQWIILLLAVFAWVQAQDTEPAQKDRSDFIISANFSSGASLLSLGFEKLFPLKANFTLAAKVGFGFNQEFRIFSDGTPPVNYFILPHHLSCNFGSKRSYFEMGVGGAWVSGDRNNYYLVYPILGYRYHPFKNPGFSFRAFLYYPFGQEFITEYNEVMFAPVGLSFGHCLIMNIPLWTEPI